ncbi:MAG: GntR family transcriptional regulator [Firmicutes bacterium]|nr:GntR family transcriptional regulator [Bacillota bacterium]MBR2001443.1 GntR family transcriptional regulator [Bacillota bacterium]MBR7147670.1 GntR family transcriptional regulator [Bacillota bacterium]
MRLPERLPRETGRDYALRTIKDNIIRLELAPGSQISENELAAEMGLSRTPVREALIELTRVKIIETYPQRKSVVALIDTDLVEEARFMRNVLECAVVEQVCEMAGPEDIERLMVNVQLQNFYMDNFYPENLMALDNEFHDILFDIAKKSQLRVLMQSLSMHFDRVRNLALGEVKSQKIVKDHEDLILAIQKKDVATARELMEKHLSRYKIDVEELRQQYPDYFK